MATTIIPELFDGSIHIKTILTDFTEVRSTNDFSPEECITASLRLKEACLKKCTHPITMTQIGYQGKVHTIEYFGIVNFEGDNYYLQVEQDIHFNQVCYNDNFNLKESFIVRYRKKKYPEFKKVIELTNSWCIMEDVDLYGELQKEFKFLTLIV